MKPEAHKVPNGVAVEASSLMLPLMKQQKLLMVLGDIVSQALKASAEAAKTQGIDVNDVESALVLTTDALIFFRDLLKTSTDIHEALKSQVEAAAEVAGIDLEPMRKLHDEVIKMGEPQGRA